MFDFFPLLRRRGCSNVSVLNNHCSYGLDLLGASLYNVGRVFDRLNHPVHPPVHLPCCDVNKAAWNRFFASIPIHTLLPMLQRLNHQILHWKWVMNDPRTIEIPQELTENLKVRIFPPIEEERVQKGLSPQWPLQLWTRYFGSIIIQCRKCVWPLESPCTSSCSSPLLWCR